MIVSHTITARTAVANGEAIFAIGDAHGLADAFYAALRTIARTETAPGLRRRLVLLGDIIDNGKDSIGCIDLAMASMSIAGVDETIPLMGNHEMMLAIALRGSHGQEQSAIHDMWIRHGGRQFLAEIGRQPGDTRRQLHESLGTHRVNWITGLKPYLRSGEVIFVHGGIGPSTFDDEEKSFAWDIPASRLDIDNHPLWMAETFLDRIGRGCHGGALVCHGHSPMDVIRKNALARARKVDAPDELADTVLTVRDFDRLNLDAGAPSKKAVRLAQFVGNTITVSHIAA